MHREQRSSSTSLGTTESGSSATTCRRLRHWQAKSHKLAKRESGKKPLQRDHRTCGGARGRPGRNAEGCAGASHWDQSPARRKDTVLPGGTRCVQNWCDRQRRKDTAALTAWTKKQHTDPEIWRKDLAQEEESGNRDSILECLSAC